MGRVWHHEHMRRLRPERGVPGRAKEDLAGPGSSEAQSGCFLPSLPGTSSPLSSPLSHPIPLPISILFFLLVLFLSDSLYL
jgi:hypothetical protein